jgi:hypothetical protein
MVEGETHTVQPGMCFSIEPGIYLPNRFGVRIEDIVTVTAEGGRRLNQTSREMRGQLDRPGDRHSDRGYRLQGRAQDCRGTDVTR